MLTVIIAKKLLVAKNVDEMCSVVGEQQRFPKKERAKRGQESNGIKHTA